MKPNLLKRIIISVLLSFLGPGLGQIYNRDYKQGIALIVISLSLIVLPVVWLIEKIMPSLPDPKIHPVSQEMVQDLAIKFINQNSHILSMITFAFIGVWAYAITQSYFKSKEIEEKEGPDQLA